MSEKVWLAYNESDDRSGVPFHFLIRDIAQSVLKPRWLLFSGLFKLPRAGLLAGLPTTHACLPACTNNGPSPWLRCQLRLVNSVWNGLACCRPYSSFPSCHRYDNTIDDALNRIYNSKRSKYLAMHVRLAATSPADVYEGTEALATDLLSPRLRFPLACSIHLGVGSRHTNQFRVVEYSHEEVRSDPVILILFPGVSNTWSFQHYV